MKINGAELTIKILEKHGIKHIAGMPGGNNLPIYDALSNSSIEHILIKNEQAAGFIAQGIARTTGKPAVCMATSGPGATNLITAIADAYMDSIPVIAITGQVSSNLLGTDAFQETDIYGMSLPIVKHNYIVKDAKMLKEIIPRAFEIACTGRPGPVLIDIPKDIQLTQLDIAEIPGKIVIPQCEKFNKPQFNKALKKISESKRPLILAGGGITHANAAKELKIFAEKNDIPVATTLMALDLLPSNHRLNLGMFGMHGKKHANKIMSKADLIIAIGTRFGDRSTGNTKAFCKDASIIHIDIDSSEINKIKHSHIALHGDAKTILKELTNEVDSKDNTEWINTVNEIKSNNLAKQYQGLLNPINIIKHIGEIVSDDSIIVTDVGQHQMWTAQHYDFKKPRTFLTSGGLGTMGFGLPAAIGAAIANPDKQIICITGDGSILMNIQEFATLLDLQLNIKIIVLNNQYLGLVRQQQDMFYKKNVFAAKFDNQYNFAEIAKAFGINGTKISNEQEYSQFADIINSTGTHVIDININEEHNVLPIVNPGKGNTEMIDED